MSDEEQIKQVLYDFEDGGLVSKDIQKVLGSIADRVIGIGIGDQGFVCSPEDILHVFESGVRSQDNARYSLTYDRLEILIHGGQFANLCADISIRRSEGGNDTKSRLLQSLVLVKQRGEWKICGMHAAAPPLTVESMEAYPLRYAEKLLRDLRAKIGEQAYQAEEQYRQAVLSDTVGFYIVNISQNLFEQCQINNALCAYAEPGEPYEEFIREGLQRYVAAEYRSDFLEIFCLKNVRGAIAEGKNELSFEYELLCPDGTALWMVSVLRLITDCVTGEHKGILYVKDIDQQKRRELEMKTNAEFDMMTRLYHKSAFMNHAGQLAQPQGGCFLMIDLDDFKCINDTWGHPAGDRVLIQFARALGACFPEGSVIGRLGGDEFGVFLGGETPREEIERAVSGFFARLGEISPAPEGPKITCSVGIARCAGPAPLQEVYRRADEALYRSKREGKGRYSFYRAADGEASPR